MVLPVAIYLDGISLTRNDSILGVFVYSLVSMRRHLVAVLRKSFLCKCGCGGRCTMWPIFAIMRWSLQALAEGRRPLTKPDGQAWSADDGARLTSAGGDMSVRACVVYLKADWAEFSKTLGLTSWASTLFPCPFCKKTQAELHSIVGLNPTHTTWPLLTHDDLERATRACEIDVVLVSESQHKEVLAALQYNRDKNGPRGRALVRDLPSLGLRAGDRLEQSSSLWALADFDEARDFPLRARFWRRGAETRTAFRNPLWDESIGLSHDILAIDILHTLYLGPTLSLVGAVFWFVVDADLWGLAQGQRSRDGRWQVNIQNLRSLLMEYYRSRRRTGGRPITELENLTVNMLGKKKGSLPNFKAAETKHLVPFLIQLLSSTPSFPEPARQNYLEAARAMQEFVRILDDSPAQLDLVAVGGLCEAYKRFVRYAEFAGIRAKPKFHLLAHVILRAPRMGNPTSYGTFEDEGLNAVLRSIGAAAHRSVWEYRVFSNFRGWEAIRSAGRSIASRKRKRS